MIATDARPRRPLAARGPATSDRDRARGFTLIELLVVILIISLVSAVALPTVLPALNHRQVSEAARLLQGALAGARDKAIHDNAPCGIRLLPDPAFAPSWPTDPTTGQPTSPLINTFTPLAYNRVIPLESAPEYSEGNCTPVPTTAYLQWAQSNAYPVSQQFSVFWNLVPGGVGSTGIAPYLVVVESPVNPTTGAPNAPTNWFWNIRLGDQIQIGNAGAWYTVAGPMQITAAMGNTELFVNNGFPATLGSLSPAVPNVTIASPISTTTSPVEYLLLVNGRDDNNNGWIDEGWDGVDNNGNGVVDEYGTGTSTVTTPAGQYTVVANEWEVETWLGAMESSTSIVNVPYTIQRRPAPSANAKEVALPTSMVIDATTGLLSQQERSRLPVSKYNGLVDVIINPDGTVNPTPFYSTPASFNMGSVFYHFWLAERQDIQSPQPGTATGVGASWSGNSPYALPIAQPGGSGNLATFPGPYLQGEYSLVSLNTRTGQVFATQDPPFFLDPTIGYTNSPGSGATVSYYNATYPFIQAEQGVNGGP